jgi:NAD(P)-dependent dehydrogenase (short-subunit alcohol dehydrogenase family)
VPHLLIIGAGPGISGATARRLGREGYAVTLLARREQTLRDEAAELQRDGVDVGWATADAADPAGLTGANERGIAERGPVDVLLHNVSVGREVDIAEIAPEQLAGDVAAGALAFHTGLRAVLPGMRERGAGTLLATGGGTFDRPIPSLPTLGVQKGALRALVLGAAAALAPLGVHAATITIRGLVGAGGQIEPARVADVYAELVAETAGPPANWRTEIELTP